MAASDPIINTRVALQRRNRAATWLLFESSLEQRARLRAAFIEGNAAVAEKLARLVEHLPEFLDFVFANVPEVASPEEPE